MDKPFYNDLDLSLSEARRLLEDGAANRKSAAHHPVVATIDREGAPSQRVMILREVDWNQRRLRFHTDSRCAKIHEIADDHRVSVLVYDPETKVQLRLGGVAQVAQDGAAADTAWHGSTLFARRCYMAGEAPGSPSKNPVSGLPEWIEGKQPTEDDIAQARANFAVLFFCFDGIEWLYLANSGHRRARWRWDSASRDWTGGWLVP